MTISVTTKSKLYTEVIRKVVHFHYLPNQDMEKISNVVKDDNVMDLSEIQDED